LDKVKAECEPRYGRKLSYEEAEMMINRLLKFLQLVTNMQMKIEEREGGIRTFENDSIRNKTILLHKMQIRGLRHHKNYYTKEIRRLREEIKNIQKN
jgi:hypothetical protein